ncbi:MAG: DciA family protein [Candidatus Paceibacterota bacterium]|jgi:hypothetical protein
MQKINLLLEKFKNLTNRNLAVREAAREILEEELSLKVGTGSLRFKDGVLYVKVSGPSKSEIFLSSESLVRKVNGRLGENAVSRIA